MPDTPTTPIVRGRSVWLRALEPRDREPFATAVQERELANYAGFISPMSAAGVEQIFTDATDQHGKTAYYFTICPLGEDSCMRDG